MWGNEGLSIAFPLVVELDDGSLSFAHDMQDLPQVGTIRPVLLRIGGIDLLRQDNERCMMGTPRRCAVGLNIML